MAEAMLHVAGRDFRLQCQAAEQRRLEDLAAALEQRLAGLGGDEPAMRQLVIVSLSLLDEAQSSGAALARAWAEIERLTDLVLEGRLRPEAPVTADERGRVTVLRDWRAP
jgi:cell division protein ZapA (FtsZ GTPase activity inhibitor)